MNNFTRPFLYGQQPIRRENPAEGQSEWYYLDPRGSDSFADMKTIDVATKDTPNPYAEELQQYWSENDPNSYREFYGNTEPPQVAKRNSSLGKFGTIDNLPSNASTSPWFSNTIRARQKTPYWPNSVPDSYISSPSFERNNNGMGVNGNVIEYNKFLGTNAFNELKNFHISKEGYTRTFDKDGFVFPYPDTHGDVTACIGHNMNKDMTSHPWINMKTNQPASNELITAQKRYLESINPNKKPEKYEEESYIRLPKEYCEQLYANDIKTRWNVLNNVIPNWEYMSPEMQAATLDIQFTGSMEPASKWKLAKKAARSIDLSDYCNNLNREETDPKTGRWRPDIANRNKWVDEMCNSGYFYKPIPK